MDAIEELRAWATSHRALRAGRGTVDDVLAFIDWYRAADHPIIVRPIPGVGPSTDTRGWPRKGR